MLFKTARVVDVRNAITKASPALVIEDFDHLVKLGLDVLSLLSHVVLSGMELFQCLFTDAHCFTSLIDAG